MFNFHLYFYFRWLSTKGRMSGPKYCKDTTYVGETGINCSTQAGSWHILSIAGCLFHGRIFVSNTTIATLEEIPTWQVFYMYERIRWKVTYMISNWKKLSKGLWLTQLFEQLGRKVKYVKLKADFPTRIARKPATQLMTVLRSGMAWTGMENIQIYIT